MAKIAAVHVMPKGTGGAGVAFANTVIGLRTLGHEVAVFADSARAGADFSPQARECIQYAVDMRKEDLAKTILGYDGLIFSDVNFPGGRLREMIASGDDKLPIWTAPRHWTSTSKPTRENMELAQAHPNWSGKLVSFWPAVEKGYEHIEWERGVLPYLRRVELQELPPLRLRKIDFGFVGRVAPEKGVIAFASALEGLSRIDDRKFTASISGAWNESPGGPHIASIANLFEDWGWTVARVKPSMKSNWSAVDPRTGSVVFYTGPFDPAYLPTILGNVKCFVNTTVYKYAPEHLEYATMEAMDAGCMIVAPDDWAPYHYDMRPIVSPIPMESYKVMKGNRLINAETFPSSPSTTYRPLAEVFSRALNYFNSPEIDDSSARVTYRNRLVLDSAHNPTISAHAHLRALHLES